MLKMRSSFVLLILSFALVYCRSESDSRRQLGETNTSRDTQSGFDRSRDSERPTGSVIGNSFERPTEGFHNRENNPQGFSSQSNNDRVTNGGGQTFGSRPVGGSNQFSNNRDGERYPTGQNRPHDEFGSGQFQSRPSNQESTNFRPIEEGNNFSGKPQGSAFGEFSGSRPGNEGSTLGQSSGFRPSNEGHSSGRPNEGLTSGGFRPGNEGNSGRPTQGSFGGSTGFRPTNEGSFGRPEEGSTFGRPDNEGHSSTRPSQGSNFGSSSGSGRPNEGLSSGQSSGFRPGNENQSGRPTQGSEFGSSSGFRPGNGGSSSFGRPNEGSTSGQSSGFRPDNESHFPGKPEESNFGQSTTTQRPTSNKEPQASENNTEGTEDGKEDDKDICFTHLGCFKMGKPWKSTLRPVGAPHPPEKIQTVIHFYSRQNPKQAENITIYPTVKMERAQFDPQKISVIIVHGFSNSGNATWMKQMKDVYLRKVDANVMITDWGKGAQLLNYLQVAGNTRVVGKQLGSFVKYLIEQRGADPGRFHLIGHSLGAQICSYLAKDVPGIARLTALDPAQPGFEGFSKEVRLDQTDAEFVDVIHTDARPFIPTLGFGMIAPHGHVDFYMNGGFDQPGCLPPPKKDLPAIKSFLDFAKFPVEAIAKVVACPHARAYEYLIEAFNETDNCIFWGHKTDIKNVLKTVTNTVTQGLLKKFTALSTTCSKDDCIPVGFATKKSPLRGAFVVTTSGRSPYCISEPGIPPETLPDDRKKKSPWEKITSG